MACSASSPRNVLETALDAELTEHLGHEHGGTPLGENMRNGTRAKTVLTQIGPVEIEVPRDRDGSFEPAIVPKRKRRLDGVDQIGELAEWASRPLDPVYPVIFARRDSHVKVRDGQVRNTPFMS